MSGRTCSSDSGNKIDLGHVADAAACYEVASKNPTCGSAFEFHTGNMLCACGRAETENSNCEEEERAEYGIEIYSIPTGTISIVVSNSVCGSFQKL